MLTASILCILEYKDAQANCAKNAQENVKRSHFGNSKQHYATDAKGGHQQAF